MKTMQSANAYEYQTYKIPRTVQQVIPMDVLYSDGMMQRAGQRKEHTYSKSWRFQDINFAVATDDIREGTIKQFSDFLRTLENGRTATSKITIHNHRVDKLRFEDDALISLCQDNLDAYRQEINNVLLNKQSQTGNIAQDKYITVTTPRRDPDEARTFFRRIENEIKRQFQKMESEVIEVDAHERLRIFHDFFRPGEELFFNFDLEASARRGHDWKDYICPDGFEKKNDHILMGNKYVRTLFLHEYGSSINENLITDLTGLNRDLVLSIDFIPVQDDEARQLVQNTLLGQTTNAARFNKKQVDSNTFMNIPFETQQQIRQSELLLEDLTERGQRLFCVLITIAHIADSKEELDSDTESLISIGRRHECRLGISYFNQINALRTALPFGARLIKGERSMTTEPAAALIPFYMRTLNDANGHYYGENAISKQLLFLNRKRLANGNGFILGYPGSGKSFIAKLEMVQAILSTNDDVIIIDPEREYQHLIKALGGEVIRISPGSENHINAMDFDAGYGEVSSIMEKSDFIVTLCEKMTKGFQRKEASIIDRCARYLYEDYEERKYAGAAPTLRDLLALLRKQPEKEAKDIAVELERYTEGSLNVFAYQTNVNLNNRILCFDTKDLGDNLKIARGAKRAAKPLAKGVYQTGATAHAFAGASDAGFQSGAAATEAAMRAGASLASNPMRKLAARGVKAAFTPARKLAARGVRAVSRALIKLMGKALLALGRALLSLVMSLGAPMILIVFFAVILILIASPFGIFMGGTTPGMPTYTDAAAEIDAGLQARINKISAATPHDALVVEFIGGTGARINNWPDILAVYATKTTTDRDKAVDVVEIDDEKIELLRAVWEDMMEIKHHTVTTRDKDEETGEVETYTTLYISVIAKNRADMYAAYTFNEEQKSLTEELAKNEEFIALAQTISVSAYGGTGMQIGGQDLPESAYASELVRLAATRLGDPYSQKLRGQDDYVDCSSLIQWAYYELGVKVPGTAAAQAKFCADNGYAVSKSDLQPGDLVFWSLKRDGEWIQPDRYMNVSHVGIYAGDGKVIEASSSAGEVVIRSLWGTQTMFARVL